MNLKTAQKIANKICDEFGMPNIEIRWNERLKWTLGIYRYTHIDLNPIATVKTLLHELAHHLKTSRYKAQVEGYFKHSTISWGLTLEIGTHHDKLFKECLRHIKWFHYGIAERKLKQLK